MSDDISLPYLAGLDQLPGLGKKSMITLLSLLGGERVVDLLLHLPTRWIDRRRRFCIQKAPIGEIASLSGQVKSTSPARASAPARVQLDDGTGQLDLVFFNASPEWLRRRFSLGRELVVSGMIEEFRGQIQMIHPDHVLDPDSAATLPPVEPHYRLCAGITHRQFSKWVGTALDLVPELPEWCEASLLRQRSWPSFKQALTMLHRPATPDPEAFERARLRLAHDEALAREIVIARSRRARNLTKATALPASAAIDKAIFASLPFVPTRAQQQAAAEISADLAKQQAMRRMLQGDVGSGKTLVAALAIAQTAHNKMRTIVMAPSEILARQQARALDQFLRPAGFSCSVLTGSDRGSARERILSDFANGACHALSGTQALFRHQNAHFDQLGLAIIDEQHRFGVSDRMRLVATGNTPHILVMSATPIPRTLFMAIHGDLDLSVLDEKPPGRPDIITRAVPDTRMDEVIKAIIKATGRKEKAFWVCPALDAETEAAAIARHARLAKVLDQTPALVHGRMSKNETEAALEAFRSGDSNVLVATTIVEVGIDIPEATIMVIESAERFGLAQLHQLRGRVGRGQEQAYCLLIYKPPLSEIAHQRIEAMRQQNNGFTIAEIDFKLRGPGDLLGSRQSGLPDFKVLDLTRDASIIALARHNAKPDKKLEKPRKILEELMALAMIREVSAHKDAKSARAIRDRS